MNKENFLPDTAIFRYIERHPKDTISDMAERIEKLEYIISVASPLAWANGCNKEQAYTWEKEAYQALLS